MHGRDGEGGDGSLWEEEHLRKQRKNKVNRSVRREDSIKRKLRCGDDSERRQIRGMSVTEGEKGLHQTLVRRVIDGVRISGR